MKCNGHTHPNGHALTEAILFGQVAALSKHVPTHPKGRVVDPWRLPVSTKELIAIVAKGLEIPKVWTAAEFIRQGRLLILALDRVAKLTQRKAVPFIAKKSVELFGRQLDRVIERAQRRGPRIRKPSAVTVEILVPQHEAIWMQALEEVFAEQNLEIVLELVPPIQSVMAQGYSRTGILLGQDPKPDSNPYLARAAQEIARKITGINNTTRDQFRRVILREIEQGKTVPELAKILRTEVMEMSHARSLTIARTETNGAYTRGAAQSMKECDTLTHVSIIGCQQDQNHIQPIYNGRGTCNYPNLPVHEIDAFLQVGFHPNHQGQMVPAGMREDPRAPSGLATLPPSALFR